MKYKFALLFLFSLNIAVVLGNSKIINLEDFNISPNNVELNPNRISTIIDSIYKVSSNKHLIFKFKKGVYNFNCDSLLEKKYYISNCSFIDRRKVGIVIENKENIELDGQGSDFIFSGKLIPVSVISSKNISIKNINIDFKDPVFGQTEVVSNDTLNKKITFKFSDKSSYLVRDNKLYIKGTNWSYIPETGIAFDKEKRNIVYNSGDLSVPQKGITDIGNNCISISWDKKILKSGNVFVFRSYNSPNPGFFVYLSENIHVGNVQLHTADGKGLVAQRVDNIYLDKFNVCIKDNSNRYFTTQGDGPHFIGCKGDIVVRNSLFENTMDDAINVHGVYLSVKLMNDSTLIATYKRRSGFIWGNIGDRIQLIKPNTLENLGKENIIKYIEPLEEDVLRGVRSLKIVMKRKCDYEYQKDSVYGIQNKTWEPKVTLINNVVRNNRARGFLLTTSGNVLIKNNVFDHVSGSAILLSGDCKSWFESGNCDNVVIKNNIFINNLTTNYELTNALISIEPILISKKDVYYHGNIIIENNTFKTFDNPILYVKSAKYIQFTRNEIIKNKDYAPFHWNKSPYKYINVKTINNKYNRWKK